MHHESKSKSNNAPTDTTKIKRSKPKGMFGRMFGSTSSDKQLHGVSRMQGNGVPIDACDAQAMQVHAHVSALCPSVQAPVCA